jgi:hypothetical protein
LTVRQIGAGLKAVSGFEAPQTATQDNIRAAV